MVIRSALYFLLLVSTELWSAEITAFIDRNPVQLNESFQLVFKAEGSVDDGPDFTPLSRDFEILNTSQSSNFSFINGRSSSSKTWTLNMMARKAGELSIPVINFGDDVSPAVKISVKSSIPRSENTTGLNSDLILELEVSNREIVVQSQLIVTLRLLTAFNINAYEMTELKIDSLDAVVEPMGKDKQYQTSRGSKNYLVLERSYAVFPQEAGELLLPAQLAEVKTGRSSGFINPFPGRSNLKRVRSNEIKVEVETVPSSFSGNNWLPAKSLKLIEEWPTRNPQFKLGEPVTRTLTLVAEGLTAAQLPEISSLKIDGIKQYSDQPILKKITQNGSITGLRQEKVAIIPSRSGKVILPEIRIPWWNTETRQMATAILPARTIEIEVGDLNTQSTEVTSSLPVPIKVDPAETIEQISSLDSKDQKADVWFYISLLLLILWLATMVYFYRRSRLASGQSTSNNSSTKIHHLDGNTLNQNLRAIKQACDQGDAKAARQSLINWTNLLYDGHQFLNLKDIGKFFGAELQAHLTHLNTALYAESGKNWQAGDLYQQCKKIQQQGLQQKKQMIQTHGFKLEAFRKF